MRWFDVDTAVTVRVNIAHFTDDTDFKTREESVVYNQSGLDLTWVFETPAGVITQTAVTPTDTAGVYDWTALLNGFAKIEIPASGGGTINNDTEGFGHFEGFATGILPWIGPTYGFRAAGLNALLIEDAYSATRALAGTALPAVAADGAGGLPISDAGGLDIDAKLANTNEITVARMGALTDWINGGRLDLIIDAINVIATDWTNGGRLDLLLDAIKVVTDILNAAASEPTGVPAANETPIEKLNYLFMMARNKITVTATKKQYFGDDDAAEFEKDVSDDGTTYTETELNVI